MKKSYSHKTSQMKAVDKAIAFLKTQDPINAIVVYDFCIQKYSVYRYNCSSSTAKQVIDKLQLVSVPGFKFHRPLPIGSTMYVLPESLNKFQ